MVMKTKKRGKRKTYKNNKTLIRKREKKRERNKERKSHHMKGGIMHSSFPVTNSLSCFPFSQSTISNFRRRFATPMDCVITTLQMIGLINRFTAEIMRISCMGKTGINTETIMSVFIIAFKRNFNFIKLDSYEQFIRELTANLPCNNVAFCGYKNQDNTNHVFLMCREACGDLSLLDGTIATNCSVTNPSCRQLLTGKKSYYLLYNSRESLTDEQIESLYTPTTFTDVDMVPAPASAVAEETDIDL